jgi:WD40 repeat protein
MSNLRALLLLLTLAVPISAAQAQEAPKPGSTVLFTLPEHDLYPENIAFDPVSEDYFLSSMGRSRILRIHSDGSYEDFLSGLEPALQSSVGMKVDAGRRRLWVCTGRYTLFGGSTEGSPQTGVLLFDLDDGSLIRSWLMDQPTPSHIFNDLAVASNGDVYVTTTLLGKVFRLSPESAEMELVLDSPGSHNNGITLSPDERYLFLTLDRSISRLDLETGDLTAIPVPDEAGTGTDGLYFVEGALVVVKPRLGQVSRLYLNASMDAVERVEVLAEGDPAFAYPTTGVVVGDRLVFVATSFADVPRNTESPIQHPDVLIHSLRLR